MGWTIIAVGFLTWFVLVLFFTPRIDYKVSHPIRPDSDEFLHVIESTCQVVIHRGNKVDILTNGAQFYPAMRDAILAAQSSVNMEAYIFKDGEAAQMLIDAMMDRARAGVEVRLTLDAVGSFRIAFASVLRRMRDAGCRVQFYQRITWYRFHRLNNRTHRELLVIDGRLAFTGGAGVADQWLKPHRHHRAWRDSMARIEGPVVAALQGVFAENWLECCGEILTAPRHWPELRRADGAEAMLVKSSPSDRATASRVVFQMLIDGAVSCIDIQTPYFLPDRSFRRALVRAAQRGIRVRVIVPGKYSDQGLVRLASRRMYRELLAGGVHLFEYRPAMTHVKALMVDGAWALIGTTNVDNRSFEHNDEVNVAFREAEVAGRLRRDFESDLAASDEITLEQWGKRPALEKLVEPVCWILERQQ
ncbi:MAG TPA: phospholipase D-like domain-containing protein [Vicinamibacterales bacterium]|nr:phospholipase D-like domain-containing protein [Vicinamibacterales bacterium]